MRKITKRDGEVSAQLQTSTLCLVMTGRMSAGIGIFGFGSEFSKGGSGGRNS